MKGIFQLNTPSDLLSKLERDYKKLIDNPSDADLAFNYFVTASCMVEWVYPDLNKPYDQKDKRDCLREQDIILQICNHIATGAKHFTVTGPSKNTVSDTQRRGGWGIQPLANPKWFNHKWGFQGRLEVLLDGNALQQIGPSISSQDLAGKILDYWKNSPLV